MQNALKEKYVTWLIIDVHVISCFFIKQLIVPNIPQVWHGSSYDYMTTLPHLVACQTYHPYSSLHHQNTPRPTQIHVQSIPHPHNNKPVQHAYNVELQNFSTLPTHHISTAPLHETYIRFGKALNPEIVEVMDERHGMTTMVNQECQSYIEDWFHSIICL